MMGAPAGLALFDLTGRRALVTGSSQGIGLALMEEIQTRDGLVTNASFTDYLLPTALDVPPIVSELVEEPEPDAPYGVKGVGEPPTVVSTAADQTMADHLVLALEAFAAF